MASSSVLPHMPEVDWFSYQLGTYIAVIQITVSWNLDLVLGSPVDHLLTYLSGLLVRLAIVDIGRVSNFFKSWINLVNSSLFFIAVRTHSAYLATCAYSEFQHHYIGLSATGHSPSL